MATSDANQNQFNVGDMVHIVGKVTAVGGTPIAPTVTIQTKYVGYDGNRDSYTADAIQVQVNK